MNLSTFTVFKNLNDVKNTININDEKLLRIQNCLLTILDDIIYVCKKYNIEFISYAGTALGAIRHEGFIPWDDDIDLHMRRCEFKRFVKFFYQELSDKYYIQDPSSDGDYALLHGRVRLKGTSYKMREDIGKKIDGIFVDIFILDNTYDNIISRNIHGFFCLVGGFLLSCRRFFAERKILFPMINGHKELKNVFVIKSSIGFLLSFLSVTKWRLFANFIYSFCKNDNSVYLSTPSGRKHFFGEMFEREKICSTSEKKFAGRLLPVPSGYDEYLTKLYGNYMRIPAPEEREKHIVWGFKV